MSKRNRPEILARLLDFILGRRPAEFGLVPDQDGYVRIKDLLKAVCEEDGWRHIRKSHLDEVRLVVPHPPIEMDGARVRAANRSNLPRITVPDSITKQLFTCVRRKAYSVVLEKGIWPTAHPFVILSHDREMAERLGRRFDTSPVVLMVSATKMRKNGLALRHAGGSLYLAERISPDCFTGPSLAKLRLESPLKETAPRPIEPKMPGSFLLKDRGRGSEKASKGKQGKKQDWKRERRRMNRRRKD